MDLDQINKEYHCLSVITDINETKQGKLAGFSVSVKDCIAIKGIETKSSSKNPFQDINRYLMLQ